MVAFTYRMPSGIPGSIQRNEHATVEAQIVMSTNPPPGYGLAVALDVVTNKIRPLGAGDTSQMVYGINVRPYPSMGAPLVNDPLGVSVPPGAGITNVMRRGYISVLLGGVTAAGKNGPAFVRIATPAAGKPVGGWEAAADGANTIQVLSAFFMGPADAQGNTEIMFNI